MGPDDVDQAGETDAEGGRVIAQLHPNEGHDPQCSDATWRIDGENTCECGALDRRLALQRTFGENVGDWEPDWPYPESAAK
jgi:hypothetical protein